MGYWRRHPDKDLEEVLGAFHEAGWRIENPGRRYYRVKCACGNHQRSIHISPSNPNHGREALRWMRRQSCMTGPGGV